MKRTHDRLLVLLLALPAGLIALSYAAICLDALQYVEDKAALVSEWLRVVHPDGFVAIAHTHNRLQHNVAQGHALSPAEYRALFANGTDDKRLRWLPRIVDNTARWRQLLSDPGAGAELGSVATRADRDGDAWVLTGQ